MTDATHSAQLPGEWRLVGLSWVSTSPWVYRVFPSFVMQAARLAERVRMQLLGEAAGLAEATLAVVDDVLAEPPGVVADELRPLCERLAEIRAIADTRALQLVHCVIAALDLQSRFVDPHPTLAAARAAGWEQVPGPCSAVVSDLARTQRAWRDAMMQGWRESPLQGFREEFGDRGLAADERRRVAMAHRREVRRMALARAAVSHAGVPAALAWLARVTTGRPARGGRPLAADNAYWFSVIRVIAADDPAILPLYEAYADVCAPDEAITVEAAAISLARDHGLEGESLLRAALRAYARDQVDHARMRADAAFVALPPDERAARAFAAALAGVLRRHDEPFAARAWLTTATNLTSERDAVFLASLLARLAVLAEQLGDAAGARQVQARMVDLGPEPLHDMIEASEVDRQEPDRGPELPGPHPDFDVREVRCSLEACRLDRAYRGFSEQMAGLLERHSATEALRVLEACRFAFAAELAVFRARHADHFLRRVPATLASWSCAALADLHELAGDMDGWSREKLQQLELEDSEGAAQEYAGGDGQVEWITSILGIHPGERCRRCIEEAQAALAGGRIAQAKFWTARAQHYRGLPG